MGTEETHERAATFSTRAFWLPKKGARAAEYEDAFAISKGEAPGSHASSGHASLAQAARFRVAVADGATEAVFSRRWAQTLADGFAREGPAIFTDALPAARRAWAEAVDATTDAGALPWYTAAKAADGAFATLMGLELHADGGPADDGEFRSAGSWRVTGVGDCNLFHLGGEAPTRAARAWPHAEASAFGTRPALVPSRHASAVPGTDRAEGTFQPGDAFVLATDAAAAWLLRTTPAAALRWDSHAAFAEAVRRARGDGALKNDDTTIVTVEVT